MKLALAQINSRVGDLKGNVRKILLFSDRAAREGADATVFPELAVTGYPPRDLLLDDAFIDRCESAVREIARETAGGPPLILGAPIPSGMKTPGHPGLYNAALLLRNGRVGTACAKRLLPAYDVFHEPRWFVPGSPSAPLDVAGRRVGFLICEDLWDEGYSIHPGSDLSTAGAEALVCISSSPFRSGVLEKRIRHARRQDIPVVFVNAVGANDELIFDGGSFATGARGDLTALLPRFEEDLSIIDPFSPAPTRAALMSGSEEIFRALVTGVRDFVLKNGLKKAFLGISGGIDSALVACIAKEALGAAAVHAVAIPTRFNDPRSTESARTLCSSLGIRFETVEMEGLHESARALLGRILDGDPGTAAENLQARLRMAILMAYVNRHGGVLLNTSNKTELAIGYGTLYGDMAGSLGVIGDLTKPQVYELSRWYDRGRGILPRFILERPPSAELRPDQVDPFDYPRISPVAEALVQGVPLPAGSAPEETARIAKLLRTSEHKRWQSGIILKVSERAFGTGRMIPVTRG